ncbi:hypothetical protein [Microbulbifer sp. SSSA005]|uniref:hypothetical protein n=1 Tax=Microbulbifer sp. SSSA005 TaxID=3243378 RepID=UPI0040392E0B
MLGTTSFRYMRIYIIFLLSCTAILQGCTGQVTMLPALQKDTQIGEQEGIVVARIINASGSSLPFNQLTINPENLNEAESIKPKRLLAARPKLDGTTVFASAVKAGNYSLSSIRAFHSNGNGWYSRFVGADEKLGTFSVIQGEITDLGTLIYYPNPQGDKYLDLLVRAPDLVKGEVLTKHFQFLDYDSALINSWHIDEKDEERESAYISVAQNPLTYKIQHISSDNSIYFLGKIGVFLKRTAAGEWELEAVDTNHELNAFSQNHHGDLVVGGSEGTLFWRPANGNWLDISLEHDSHIEHLALLDTGEIELVVSRDFEVNILKGTIVNTGVQWELLNRYSSSSGKGWEYIDEPRAVNRQAKSKNTQYIYSTTIFKLNGLHYITIRKQSIYGSVVFTPTSSESFIYNPENWIIEKSIDEFNISNIVDVGAVKLGIEEAGIWSLTGKPTYYRIDENGIQNEIVTYLENCPENKSSKSYCRVREFTLQSAPRFSSPNDAIAIASFTGNRASHRNQEVEIKLLKTSDGGRSWGITDSEPPTNYCTSLVPQVADRLLVSCDGASGDFYESNDFGDSWHQVRRQENF